MSNKRLKSNDAITKDTVTTNNLSTVLKNIRTNIRLAIGKRYLKVKTRVFFIPEVIFVISGSYLENIFSKITLLNGAKIPVAMIVQIIVIMILMSIAFNFVDISKMARQWWRSLK